MMEGAARWQARGHEDGAMLNRQKCLLYMIERAGRPVRRFELTKWAFLLAHDTPSGGGAAFYQFLPFRFGPFSFCLFREADALVRDGYLVEPEKSWRLAKDMRSPVGDLPGPVRGDAAGVVERFVDRAPEALRDYVYARFPWFTVNSTSRGLDSRPVACPAVYTAGYEGWLVDGFLNMLMRAGIRRLIDVRSNPVARRYGFHKATLGRLCGEVEIMYLHLPELGIRSELRRDLTAPAAYNAIFARYEAETLPREADVVDRVAELVSEKPTVLMCAEADPHRCHRARLAKVVARMAGLPVRDLGGDHETGV